MAATVLITGAGGLIGSHVLAAWDIEELSLMPAPTRSESSDLLVPGTACRLVSVLRPAIVIHLAWVASGTPGYRTSPDNERWVAATLELANASQATGARFLGTGTSLEGDEACAGDAYTAAKAKVRLLLGEPIARGEIGWLQPFYVFDPDRGRPALVADALRARASGTEVVLRSPHQVHDFVHAADVGRAIVACVRAGLTGQVPIGSGTTRQVCDLVSGLGISWVAGRDAVHVESHAARPADTGRLRSTGWFPTSTEEFFKHV